MKKILYILRHAKAEAGSATQDDHERGLMERGVNAALAMGEYMQKQNIVPDRVLCSTAVRAKETWRYVGEHCTPKHPVEYIPKLYMASANEIRGVLAKLPDAVSSALVVGHNPGIHQLALKLALDGDDALLDTLSIKYPTCTLTAIAFDDPWSELSGGTLERFITPKMLGIEAK